MPSKLTREHRQPSTDVLLVMASAKTRLEADATRWALRAEVFMISSLCVLILAAGRWAAVDVAGAQPSPETTLFRGGCLRFDAAKGDDPGRAASIRSVCGFVGAGALEGAF